MSSAESHSAIAQVRPELPAGLANMDPAQIAERRLEATISDL